MEKLLVALVLLETFYMTYAIDCYNCTGIRNVSNCHHVEYCPKSRYCFIQINGSGGNKTYTLGCASELLCGSPATTVATSVTMPSQASTLPMTSVTNASFNSTITTTEPSTTTTDDNTTAETNATTVDVPTSTITHNTNTKPPPKTTTYASTAAGTNTTTESTIITSANPQLITGIQAVGVGRRDWLYHENYFLHDEPAGSHPYCCETDTYNKHLIEHKPIVAPTHPDTVCHDKPGFDCSIAMSFFDVCNDTQNAKTLCKKSCNICDLVDGMWSEWGNWSSCDVTCGNGTKERMRTCDEPKPAFGGDNCTGSNMETQFCTEQDCPVDGNWANWMSWTDCSVTCGIGLQKRIRNCSNPYPEADGLFCLGASSDEKICTKKDCNQAEVGEWQDWSSWSECSLTCDTGMKTRTRDCNGTACSGDVHEWTLCVVKECPDPMSAFLVSGVPHNGPENGTIVLTRVLTNVGGDYNTSSGQFTCRIPGVYSFFISIEKQLDVNQAYCQLMKNDTPTIYIGSRSSFVNYQHYQQASNSAVLELDVDDVIYLGMCSDAKTFTTKSTFSGSLLAAGADDHKH